VDKEEDSTLNAGAGEAAESSRPSSAGGADADLQPPPGVSWKRSKAKQKGDKKKKDSDYYALLGLQNERWTATDQQIKLGGVRTVLGCGGWGGGGGAPHVAPGG
jgi:DnaJ family protein C protein 2